MIVATTISDIGVVFSIALAMVAALALPTITRSKRVQGTLDIQGRANDELRKANADVNAALDAEVRHCAEAIEALNKARLDDYHNCEKQIAELEGKLKFAVDGDMAHVIADAVAHAIRSKPEVAPVPSA